MSWGDIVSEGYGLGAGGGMARYNKDGEHRKSNSRICLSISDLSRIFPSTSEVHDGDDNGHCSRNMDNGPTPMMCYNNLNNGSSNSVYSESGDNVKRRVSSAI